MVAGAIMLLAGCGPLKVSVTTSPDLDKYRVRTLAVMPFDAVETPQVADRQDTAVQGPVGVIRSDISLGTPPQVERTGQPTAKVPAAAAATITGLVHGHLSRSKGLTVLSLSSSEREWPTVKNARGGMSVEKAAGQAARRLSADAVLIGRVLVYQERVGSKWGATPAVVGFEMRVIAADGETLWIGNYYEQQRPMGEDFAGFLERGGVFVTADELAQYGVDHVLAQFPFGLPPSR